MSNNSHSYNEHFIPGPDALSRRDRLEAAVTLRFPSFLQPQVSRGLTWLTGLAPANAVELYGSERQSFLINVAALVAGGTALMVYGWPGVLPLLHGMRSFSSVNGHHATHGAKMLPVPARTMRRIYDVMSALLILPSFDAYKSAHQEHHAYTAGADDPDEQFIAYLGVRFDQPWRFWGTLLDPWFHARFFWARLKAVLGEGAWWRRMLGGLVLAGVTQLPAAALLWWLLVTVVLYQVVTVLQWAGEHLHGRRPERAGAVETALAVTFGRLLLPDPAERWWWVKLPWYVLVRSVLLSGDLPAHVLHHAARGPWTAAPYVMRRLLEEGKLPLRQTGGVRAMFRVVFESARGVTPVTPRKMDGEQMLGM